MSHIPSSSTSAVTTYICPRNAAEAIEYGSVAPEVGNTTATFALNVYVPDADATAAQAEPARGDCSATRRGPVLWEPDGNSR